MERRSSQPSSRQSDEIAGTRTTAASGCIRSQSGDSGRAKIATPLNTVITIPAGGHSIERTQPPRQQVCRAAADEMDGCTNESVAAKAASIREAASGDFF